MRPGLFRVPHVTRERLRPAEKPARVRAHTAGGLGPIDAEQLAKVTAALLSSPPPLIEWVDRPPLALELICRVFLNPPTFIAVKADCMDVRMAAELLRLPAVHRLPFGPLRASAV